MPPKKTIKFEEKDKSVKIEYKDVLILEEKLDKDHKLQIESIIRSDESLNDSYLTDIIKYNASKVEYKGLHVDGNLIGRLIPNIHNITNMKSSIRSALFKDTHTDIDAITCQISILLYIAKKYNLIRYQWQSDILEEFITNKNEMLKGIHITDKEVEKYNKKNSKQMTKIDIGKEIINRYMFGSTDAGIMQEFGLSDFPIQFGKLNMVECAINGAETGGLAKYILDYDKEELGERINLIKRYLSTTTKKVHNGTILAWLLQTYETEATLKAISLFQSKGFIVSAYIYDGFIVESKDTDGIDAVLNSFPKDFPFKMKRKEWKSGF